MMRYQVVVCPATHLTSKHRANIPNGGEFAGWPARET